MLLHSVAVQNVDFTADGVNVFDLGVNPLSMILLNIRPLNDTGTLTNYIRFLGACSALNRVSIRHRGESILSMTGLDLGVLAVMRHGYQPWFANPGDTNNERICVTLPIFMGRRAYDPDSCFPETRRGEFQLEVDVDDADTGYDNLNLSVETVEILGAKPKEYERKVQLAQTFASVGVNVVDIPLGNLMRGFLLFGTTGFSGASPAPTWGRVSITADGVGVGVSSADWESLHNMTGLRTGIPVGDHIHVETDSAGPTGAGKEMGVGFTNHAYLDLDPMMNDRFAIDSSDVSRLQLRAEAEAAEAVRVIPIERIKV